jgi:predicted CopG family antitoxin
MSKASKRIPLTEERWKELHELKEPGQTWDDLLGELVEEHKAQRLAEMVREKREDGDFVEVDTDDW